MNNNTSVVSADQWWNSATNEIKYLFWGSDNETVSTLLWEKLNQWDKDNIYRYWQYRTGKAYMCEDDAHSLLMEILCELADTIMENDNNMSREDMCDQEGCFLEEYQEVFNNLYDDIEDRISSYDF